MMTRSTSPTDKHKVSNKLGIENTVQVDDDTDYAGDRGVISLMTGVN